MTVEQWWRLALAGDARGIARCITRIEEEAPGVTDGLRALPAAGGARIIGVTGPPGAGKSTLVDALIGRMTAMGRRVAVLCVDPSSPFSHGAILGDRVRMSRWYRHPDVYIRSLATRGSLGGLHPHILEIAQFLGACPFDDILVETVGVGQSEVEITALADVTVVVLVPESGDEIQTMKAGLMEIADIFAVNKCDRPDADLFVAGLHRMMTVGHRSEGPPVPVVRTVASREEGVAELLEAIDAQAKSPVSASKRLDLMADRAWHLIMKKRMKDVRKADLRARISALEADGTFNLYSFIENY
jgi:LAO/AO transport system kinase